MKRSNETPEKIAVNADTRFNSTAYMLNASLTICSHLDEFCSYLHTEEECAAFTNCSKNSTNYTQTIFLLQDTCSILQRFGEGTEALSDKKHPMWFLTLPMQRTAEVYLTECKMSQCVFRLFGIKMQLILQKCSKKQH